jgi:hypothetical protein
MTFTGLLRMVSPVASRAGISGILATSSFLPPPSRSPPHARRPPGELAYDADPILDLDQVPAFDPTEPEPIRTTTSVRPGAPESGAAPAAPATGHGRSRIDHCRHPLPRRPPRCARP